MIINYPVNQSLRLLTRVIFCISTSYKMVLAYLIGNTWSCKLSRSYLCCDRKQRQIKWAEPSWERVLWLLPSLSHPHGFISLVLRYWKVLAKELLTGFAFHTLRVNAGHIVLLLIYNSHVWQRSGQLLGVPFPFQQGWAGKQSSSN